MEMTASEKALYLDGDYGLKPYLRLAGEGMPNDKIRQIAWLLLNGGGCGFCKVCRDEDCRKQDGQSCTDNIAQYIRECVRSEKKDNEKDGSFAPHEFAKNHQKVYRVDTDPKSASIRGNIQEFSVTGVEFTKKSAYIKCGENVVCEMKNVVTSEPYLDYYRCFLSREEAEKFAKEITGAH